jgi:metal-sulfur cluster biosynthetic enzyme
MNERTEESVLDLLRQVYDPELGINIVDLGLIYGMEWSAEEVSVRMTLTTPGCPMHDTIAGGVKYVLQDQLGFMKVKVDVVWEPAWTPSMMTDEAKTLLGYC